MNKRYEESERSPIFAWLLYAGLAILAVAALGVAYLALSR
jgi:hypothetical protein